MAIYRTDDGLEVEWDDGKDRSNRRKHGVAFQEAATVFADSHSLVTPDDEHSVGEARYHIIGLSEYGELLTVAFTERGARVRLITARKSTRPERRNYEEGS